MRILIAPDSFKGSLSATEVIAHLGRGLADRGITFQGCPLADGGDGSVQAAVHAGYRAITVVVSGPTGRSHNAEVAFDGRTCVVEVANTCGLALLPNAELEPLNASSRGLGDAVRAALDLGPQRIVLALGGSASTDGGSGLLASLGMQFLDEDGRVVDPGGGELHRVRRILASDLVELRGVELVIASDVDSPLTGALGSAAVFGPQKGATATQVALLDSGLLNLVDRIRAAGYENADELAAEPGAGSAGGLGFAGRLLGGTFVSGAEFFLDLQDYDGKVAGCDLVITGEGRIDAQTGSGKVPAVVARRAPGVPVIAVVGRNELDPTEIRDLGLAAVYSLADLSPCDPATDPVLSAQLLRQVGRTVDFEAFVDDGRQTGTNSMCSS